MLCSGAAASCPSVSPSSCGASPPAGAENKPAFGPLSARTAAASWPSPSGAPPLRSTIELTTHVPAEPTESSAASSPSCALAPRRTTEPAEASCSTTDMSRVPSGSTRSVAVAVVEVDAVKAWRRLEGTRGCVFGSEA